MSKHTVQLRRPLTSATLVAAQPAGGAAAESEPARAADAAERAAQAAAAAAREDARRLDQALQQLNASLQANLERRREDRAALTALAVDLATVAAGQLALSQISAGQLDIPGIVARTLAQLPQTDAVEAALHPEDLRQLNQQPSAPLPWDPSQLRLVADPSLPRGACRVEGPRQGVLEHWGHALAEMHRAMLEEIYAE